MLKSEDIAVENTCDVFIVDDEPDTLRLAQKTLEREKFVAKTAVNGNDAMQLIKKRGLIGISRKHSAATSSWDILEIN